MMKIEKSKYINEFVAPVFGKKSRFDLSSWLLLRKTTKSMKKISPDFDTMYKIWDMLNIFHECYMHSYSDDSNLNLFLATIPKGFTNNNTFCMIYKEERFTIKFVLQLINNTKFINIEITRSNKTGAVPEKISFEDGTYSIQSDVEMEKFSFIISCLMNGAIKVIKHYYKFKRF